jgi:hypothetical protein
MYQAFSINAGLFFFLSPCESNFVHKRPGRDADPSPPSSAKV